MRFHLFVTGTPATMANRYSCTPMAGNLLTCCAARVEHLGAFGPDAELALEAARTEIAAGQRPGMLSAILVPESDRCLATLLGREAA